MIGTLSIVTTTLAATSTVAAGWSAVAGLCQLQAAQSPVPEHSTASRKGQAPTAATGKGFGKQPK